MQGGLEVLRIDDIPLLYAQIKELKVQQIIDGEIVVHKNRKGISLGHLISLWLCYLLSESDHRLESVEGWAASNLKLLQSMSGERALRVKDFTDDRLEQALDYLSEGNNWENVNGQFVGGSPEVYKMDGLGTVRLDAAPMQGHHKIKAGGLFQQGYGKHHDNRLGCLR